MDQFVFLSPDTSCFEARYKLNDWFVSSLVISHKPSNNFKKKKCPFFQHAFKAVATTDTRP